LNASQGFVLFRHSNYQDAVPIACQAESILQLQMVEFSRYQQTSMIQEVEASSCKVVLAGASFFLSSMLVCCCFSCRGLQAL
jgi:hypothetical protein